MAQGKTKYKSQLPSGVKQKQQRHKKTGPRKGGRIIAPKKNKHMEAVKLKRGLERAIKTDIEHEITMKAKSSEPKSFHIVKSATDVSKSAKSTS